MANYTLTYIDEKTEKTPATERIRVQAQGHVDSLDDSLINPRKRNERTVRVGNAFYWATTPQGSEYWWTISQLFKLERNYIKWEDIKVGQLFRFESDDEFIVNEDELLRRRKVSEKCYVLVWSDGDASVFPIADATANIAEVRND